MSLRVVNCLPGMPEYSVRIQRAERFRVRAPAAGGAMRSFFSRIVRHRQLIFSYVRAPAGLSLARTAAR